MSLSLLSSVAALGLFLIPAHHPQHRTTAVRMGADEEVDWREMRARLMAQEKQVDGEGEAEEAPAASGGFVYESPLIEQGTILLGGTQQAFGFALRQQFFHKCVLLLLHHDEQFTKGIILNRPTALELDGWRVWCGHGQVAEGGIFVGEDAAIGQLEINCLHSLEGFVADKCSTRVIKGVSYTSLTAAKALVAAGAAKKSDFYVCVGYSGWAPGQLQSEVDARDSWYLAAADGGTLLEELLRQTAELPPKSYYSMPGASCDDLLGKDTWASLMRGIGRAADVAESEGSLSDRMLSEWIRAHLLPKPTTPAPSASPPQVAVGSVVCSRVAPATGRPADRVLLREQFLHKSVMLIIDELEQEGTWVACVLNRPTATLVQFNTPGSPRRRLPVCGDKPFRGSRLNGDGSGQLWLHYRSELGGSAFGESGLYSLASDEVMRLLEAGEMQASELMVLSGIVEFGRAELAGMLTAGEASIVPPGAPLRELWPRVWALNDAEGDEPSDGTDVWYIASQCGSEQLAAPAPAGLADEALDEWLKFFARS